jgi:hypothetical protein
VDVDVDGEEGRGPILHVPPSKHGDVLVARKLKKETEKNTSETRICEDVQWIYVSKTKKQ